MLSVGVMLPLATDWTEAAQPKHGKKYKKVKKYSKAWWRQYRAKQRRQIASAVRRRAARRQHLASVINETKVKHNVPEIIPAQFAPVLGNAEPKNWKGQYAAVGGEVRFSVADDGGQQIGSAQLAVVAPAIPNGDDTTSEKSRSRTLGGVPITSLRRTVIDRMIKENGYIVNDYQREVGGKRVFVVVAQTQNGGATQSKLFYFTEVEGRIFSLATDSANDFSDKLAADSEKVLSAMHRKAQPTQSADLK